MAASTSEAMLHFIYTDKLPPALSSSSSSASDRAAAAGDLLVAADRYDLERLRLMCERILAESIIDAATAMTTLMLVHGRDSWRPPASPTWCPISTP